MCVAMAHAQPPVALRCLYGADIAEAIWAVLFVVVALDAHAILHYAMWPVYTVRAGVRKICAEGAAAAHYHKLIFL